MSSFLYDQNGNLMDIRQWGPDSAYVDGQEVPFITGNQLRQYAAIVYAESASMGILREINPDDPVGEMYRETVCIAIAMYNYTRAKGTAFHRAGKVYGLQDLVQDASYVKSINTPVYQEYFGVAGDPNRRRFATLAVLKLFQRRLDDIRPLIRGLQGALYWDGNDIFRLFPNHYRCRMGMELGDPAHGAQYQNVRLIQGVQVIQSCPATDPRVSSRRQYTFLSTLAAGGSIFYRIHPEAAAQGIVW